MIDKDEQLKFEESLKPGDEVMARWSRLEGWDQASAFVVRVNRMSIRVRSRFSKRELTLPRITQRESLRRPYHGGWSEINGIFPTRKGAANG